MGIFQKQQDLIDAVILDLSMPHMSGKQVFQRMIEINPGIRVLISSGHGDEYTKEGIFSKVKGNISKPYKVKDLAQAVRSVLDS